MKVYTLFNSTNYRGISETLPMGVFISEEKAINELKAEFEIEKSEGTLLNDLMPNWEEYDNIIITDDYIKIENMDNMYELRIDEQELI